MRRSSGWYRPWLPCSISVSRPVTPSRRRRTAIQGTSLARTSTTRTSGWLVEGMSLVNFPILEHLDARGTPTACSWSALCATRAVRVPGAAGQTLQGIPDVGPAADLRRDGCPVYAQGRRHCRPSEAKPEEACAWTMTLNGKAV